MFIIDESERVSDLAKAVLDTDNPWERADWHALLEGLCYSSAMALDRELERSEDTTQALHAAIDAYRLDRQHVIEYRRRQGLPCEGVE